MGFFDKLAQVQFGEDDDGLDVFFPWGIFGKGYRLPDPSSTKRARRLVAVAYKVGFILGLPVLWASILGSNSQAVVLIASVCLAYSIAYNIAIRACVSGLETSRMPRSYREHQRQTAKALGRSFLAWLIAASAIMSVVFSLIAIATDMVTDDDTWWNQLVLWGFAVLAVGCIGYFYYLRRLAGTENER